MVKFENTRRQLSEKDLNEVERRIGLRLPADLRSHYIAYNGGRPNPRYFPCGGELYGVHYFLEMMPDKWNGGFEETFIDLALSNPHFPIGYIPFATDETGDYFLYSIRPAHFGDIAFIQWDYFDDESRFVVKLSDSLSKFIASLVDDDE